MRDTVPSDAILERLLSLHPKIIDLTLDRVERLLARLGHPERALPPVIHVAGTNGKGSTIAMIRAGLEGTGQSVHVYTSPHLARFHERIRVAGRLIAEPDLSALLEECERVNGGEPITFFEITTVAAFLAFARTPADRLLLEVGLGGRLDATNVIARPELTVITPVSYDHQQYLGETIEEIAFEKAGILKPGVPCIVGPQIDAGRTVIEGRAAEIGAPLMIHGQDWMARAERGRLIFEDGAGLLDLDLPALPGPHQIENAGAAIAALRALGLGEEACRAAVTRAEWPARMQRLRRGPLVDRLPEGVELWLDGGHNASAGEALAGVLDEMAAKASVPVPVSLVVGMIDTKAAENFLAPMAGRVGAVATVTIPGAPAAIPADRLAERARTAGHDAVAKGSLIEALDHVLGLGTGPRRVLICGSLYLAGHVLQDNG
jgi:dihydrofolate synthase/folylpolyglutamate synthase